MSAKTGDACAFDGKVTNTDFAVSSEAILLSQPEEASAPVQLAVGNSSVPAPLELSASVRELCRSGKWSEVYVASNPHAKMQGWVLSSALKAVPVTKTGRRIYQANDFTWPENTGSAKADVVQIANRIMDQRRECLALDTENLMLVGPGDRGTFSLPCFVPLDTKSFDFRAADAKSGRSFFPVLPIEKAEAYLACEEAVKMRSAHPSTVDMSLSAIDFRDGGDGRTELSTTFSAKNSFNLELDFDVSCSFSGRELANIAISER